MRLGYLFASITTIAMVSSAIAEETFPAKLAGHAYLPALTMITPPTDAPQDAWVSGKFTSKARNDNPMSIMGNVGKTYGNHTTGISLPFIGQPVQGMSGFAMNRAEDGSIFTLTDNGFGTKLNSPDALLFFHRMKPDFETGKVERVESIFLHDPDKKVPFRIAYEGTNARYLTGADFDPESIQYINGEIWIGDEFGPYIIHAGLDGRVKAVYKTKLDGKLILGPDTHGVVPPAVPGKDYVVQRSGGYEGMALQPKTNYLWAMLEKPLYDDNGKPEGDFLRVIIFDTDKGEWTGDNYRFRLAEGATAIGDFNFIDDTRALVIERDNGEGDPSLECKTDDLSDCYPFPAKVKNIVLVDTSKIDVDGYIHRIATINLMDIQDPDNKAILKTAAARDLKGKFTFPFFTIENVMRVDDTHILIANDNNLPFSGGRQIGEAANNEFIMLEVADFLNAR